MLELGVITVIPFLNPSQGIELCQHWIKVVPEDIVTVDKITRNTHICALHRPGARGPTDKFPEPLKVNFTACVVFKASRPKRKAPQPRVLVNKLFFSLEDISSTELHCKFE